MRKGLRRGWKVVIAVVGSLVVVIGLILVPFPGPGWLIVFMGLAILATEFAFAARIRDRGRTLYDEAVAWLGRQHWSVQFLSVASSGLAVAVVVWLVNGFGFAADFLGLDVEWLHSPFYR